jgi:O-succinylbenzoic acid--CoA ligase
MPTYGMTEAASQITTLLTHELRFKRESVGLSLSGIEIKIIDGENQSQELATGTIGQILVKGANVMGGYLNHPQNCEWFATGDLGYLDSDRYLYVISGGENIYPSQIEAILLQHPAIAEVCVIGLEEQEWGAIVAAVIVLNESSHISLTEVRAFCTEKGLSRYKLPKAIYVVEHLPKSASGKILRQELKQK